MKARRSDQELQNCRGGYCSVPGRVSSTCRCSGRLWMISRVDWSIYVSELQPHKPIVANCGMCGKRDSKDAAPAFPTLHPQIETCQWGGGNTNCFGESRHARIRNTPPQYPKLRLCQWGVAIRIASERAVTPESVHPCTPNRLANGGGNTNCWREPSRQNPHPHRQIETCQWGVAIRIASERAVTPESVIPALIRLANGGCTCFGESRHARIRNTTQIETCQWGVAIRIASERAVTPESVTPVPTKDLPMGGGNTNCFGEPSRQNP